MTIEDADSSIIYGLDYQARAMCSISTEQDAVQFLIGTQTLKFENQVCLLTLDEDTNQITKQNFNHPLGEIWHISSSPIDANVFITCYRKVEGNRCLSGCSVWSYDVDTDDSNPTLNSVTSLDIDPSSSLCCFHWQPSTSNCKKGFVLYDKKLSIVDCNFAEKTCPLESTAELDAKTQHKFVTGKWNPHHNCNTIAAAVDTAITGWDIRSMKQTYSIEGAHIPTVRDLDFNPNRQYILASSGDDCKIKFWDVRNPDKPLATLAKHSHWVWCVRYNPIHDQLVLSCSSDARVVLSCVSSISSESQELQTADPDESDEISLEDGVVRTYEEHEESVYSCEWASSDPWIFASLSYDGRVILSRVPREVKYKIMQL